MDDEFTERFHFFSIILVKGGNSVGDSRIIRLFGLSRLPHYTHQSQRRFLESNRSTAQHYVNAFYQAIVNSCYPHLKKEKSEHFIELEVEGERLFVKACPYSDDRILLVVLPVKLFPSIEENHNRSKEMAEDLNAIINLSWDIIYVINADGMTLRVKSINRKNFGTSP